MDRRTFIKLGGAGVIVAGTTGLSFTACDIAPAELSLGAGYTGRVIATSGRPVGATGYTWHPNPDGGACFPATDGGWIYVSNSESIPGSVSMVRFNSVGNIAEARQIVSGTNVNCAGGATPWGTWLTCEEYDSGQVWECDPTGASPGVARPLMGKFKHEAAAADATNHVIYLTEDQPDGCFYRFVPSTWGDLSAGALQVLTETSGVLAWAAVPDPAGTSLATRKQVATARKFNGGEGTCMMGGNVHWTTKGDNKVWRYDPTANALSVVYDVATSSNPILSGVDNITSRGGDLYVAEDGGDMQIVKLASNGTVSAVVQVNTSGSEITGPAFSPDGTRLYFSSQRNPGVTYEIKGPF